MEILWIKERPPWMQNTKPVKSNVIIRERSTRLLLQGEGKGVGGETRWSEGGEGESCG